jgi:hypothetical protein
MAHLTTAGSAVVSTAEFPVLRAADLRDGTGKVQVFAHAVAHAIESHPRLHAATRVIHQCIEPAAKEALTVYLSGLHEDDESGYDEHFFEYPDQWDGATLNLNPGNDPAKLKRLKEFELDWLARLRSAVALDSHQSILDGASAIPLGVKQGDMLSPNILLSYQASVTEYFSGINPSILSELENSKIVDALTLNWWKELRVRVRQPGSKDEDYKAVLQRLGRFVAKAKEAMPIINALTCPAPIPVRSEAETAEIVKRTIRAIEHRFEPSRKHARFDNQSDTSQSDSKTLPQSDQSKELKNITYKCRDCNSDFVFTVGEQEFHIKRGFKEHPKSCKRCKLQKAINETETKKVPDPLTPKH